MESGNHQYSLFIWLIFLAFFSFFFFLNFLKLLLSFQNLLWTLMFGLFTDFMICQWLFPSETTYTSTLKIYNSKIFVIARTTPPLPTSYPPTPPPLPSSQLPCHSCVLYPLLQFLLSFSILCVRSVNCLTNSMVVYSRSKMTVWSLHDCWQYAVELA